MCLYTTKKNMATMGNSFYDFISLKLQIQVIYYSKRIMCLRSSRIYFLFFEQFSFKIGWNFKKSSLKSPNDFWDLTDYIDFAKHSCLAKIFFVQIWKIFYQIYICIYLYHFLHGIHDHWGKADDRNCNYGHPKMADVESGKNVFCRLNCFYNVF